ncbi:4-oxalomesaconate tautomerase [Rhizobium sp.]
MSDRGLVGSEDGVRCMWMRGGTSKGGYFLAEDLPADRDAFLLKVMGSPDARQIDGMGGANPLTSKVAVVKRSERHDADVDYLFLQVFVDKAIVTDAQNCGNILAGIGPFAIERGLVAAEDGETEVRIFMENTGQIATARVATPDGNVTYSGVAQIDGVPGTAAAVPITFADTAGSSCGALLPSGNAVDVIEGVACTLIDNGMPVVIMRASDLGIAGGETPAALDANETLRSRLEAIRVRAGPMMNLGDISAKSIPKMTMVSQALTGGTIATRTFIPHKCHDAIGVLGAVSVATACLLPAGPAFDMADLPAGDNKLISVEHPTGEMSVVVTVRDGAVANAAVLRTARKLFDGRVFG